MSYWFEWGYGSIWPAQDQQNTPQVVPNREERRRSDREQTRQARAVVNPLIRAQRAGKQRGR